MPVNANFVAGNTIAPCRFVTMTPNGGTPAAFTVWQATVGAVAEGDQVFGVSQEGTDAFNSANAAVAGEQLRVFGPGELCLLELGGTVTAGDRLKATTSGKGVTTTTDKDRIGAVALESGTSGSKIQVQVRDYNLSI